MQKNYKIVDFNDKILSNILKNEYPDIFAQMNKEDYILEYDSFVEFRELIYEGDTVGFLTLDYFMNSKFLSCLNECYILPEYRGKGILFKIIKELLEEDSLRFYVRRPNQASLIFC